MKINRIYMSIAGLLLAIACFCMPTAFLHAQSSTQGSIAGTVIDPSGAVVSNAAVTIRNAGTNSEIKLSTDSNGAFRAPLVEPGTYSVLVTATGFAPYRTNNVPAIVGKVTNIDPHLSLATSSSEVVVSEQAPVMNLDSPDFSSSVDQKVLQSIPVNNRRWSSLAMTTPGVVSNGDGYGLIAVRGISPILNNVMIDGADDNQAYFSEERGRTREAYSTSGMAVREFQVNSGVYAAEYGRAAGGVINSVTRSGTNNIHGVAYFFDRESNWNAFNNYTTNTTATYASGSSIPTSFVTSAYKPKDLRKIYGFTAGGPLIKDKIFWMYTYDQHTHINPGVANPANPKTFYTTPSATTTGNCNLTTGYLSGDTNAMNMTACTLAAREGLASYAAGAAAYTAGIASFLPDLGLVKRAGYQEINTPKLDWQINSKNHVSFLFHRLRWDAPGDVQTQATAPYSIDAWGTDFVKLDYGVTKLTSMITSNISNELLYQFSRELNDEGQQPYSDYTKTNLVGAGGYVPQIALNTSVGFNLGSPYYSYRTAYPDEHKWQVADSVFYMHKKHTFKFGVDMVHNYDRNDALNNDPNGYYTYSSMGNYFADLYSAKNGKTSDSCDKSGLQYASATATAVGNYQCYSSYAQSFGPTVFSIATMDYGFYGQDNWKIAPRLTLQLGVRYEYESLPAPPIPITAIPQTSNHPSDKNNIGPRVGFSYDVFGRGKTILRGGYGMYYGRITNGIVLTTYQNSGNLTGGQYTTTFKPTAGATTSTGAMLPNRYPSTGTAPTPSVLFMDSHMQNPQVHEFDLQVQQEFGHGTIFQLSYLGALGRELPNFLNVNLDPTTAQTTAITVVDSTGKGPLPNGQTYQAKTYTHYGNAALFGTAGASYQGITEVLSNINSNYHALVVEVQNRVTRNLQFDVNYTWSHAMDYNQNATTNLSGTSENWLDPYSNARSNYSNSNYNVPHRFVAYASYDLPGLHTAGPLKYLINDWSVSDSFQMQNGLPYSAALKSTYNSSAAVLQGWFGTGASTYIPVIGHNTYTYPRRIVDDVRLTKAISLKDRYKMELMLNVFNIANHQNVDGISSTAYSLSSTSATSGTATYQSTFGTITNSNNSGFLYTPRNVEIAAKFSF